MDKKQILRKDIIDAWERYINKTDTCDDLALILDSIITDDHIQEFSDVFNRMAWNKAMNELPPTPEEKEEYRKEFAQLLAEYEKLKTIPVEGRVKNHKPALPKEGSKFIGSRFRKIWYAAAAVILLGLLIPSVYLFIKPEVEQTVQYIEEKTGRGEIKTIILSDRTEVTLNAGSHIKYPTIFTGDKRLVELFGEALFDVTSDPVRPFIVKTEHLNVKVVGTVFDVKEYTEDLMASVSVASGKVAVETLNSEFTGCSASLMLEENRQVKLDKATGNVETISIDVEKSLLWTDGTLYFNRTPIREVINVLIRQYPQVDIELAEGEYNYLITGRHNNIYHPEDILKGITYTTGLKYKKTGNKYILYED